MLEKRQTSTKLVISSRGVHMLFLSMLVIHGYGIVYGLAVELMVVSAILTLIQVLMNVMSCQGIV